MVTLQDMLQAKEQRRDRQVAFRKKYAYTLVSITINMPGAEKDTVATRLLCDYAIQTLREETTVVAVSQCYLRTGPEALLAIDGEARAIKALCMGLEEQRLFGRLLDLDVFTAEGSLLSRQEQGGGRGCFVCGGPVTVCMRERRHGQMAIREAVQHRLYSFYAYRSRHISPLAEKIGALAVEAMLYEVTCTPSPGLVDRFNAGAHRDMDFYTFMASSAALSNALARCAQAGSGHAGPLPELLPVLRVIGREGDAAMLLSTGGVNTQKGLLFLLGIVAAVAGYLYPSSRSLTSETIAATAAELVTGIVERELGGCTGKDREQLTAGERLYQDYGVTGIRGELEAGLPVVINKALPALRAALAAKLPLNDCLLQTLLVLMTAVEDTTVMNRHNPDTMRVWVRQEVSSVLAAGGLYTQEGRQLTAALDALFIMHNISPGGAADLLAVTWFLHKISTDFCPGF